MTLRRLIVLTLLLSACKTAPEQSVKPGINDSYRNVDDPSRFVERFEREGREVYDLRNEIAATCALQPGEDLADIGAGTGLFVPLFAEAVGPGGIVYAVDIVPAFLELIAERAEERGLANVSPVLCTDDSVILTAGTIDVAFICDTYHHFEYPRSTLSSLHEALRPGGRLVIVDFERIEGESSDWILGHVRAGKEVVRAEIEAAGFEFVDEVEGILKDNYIIRYRRP